jgi:hypothetical protein
MYGKVTTVEEADAAGFLKREAEKRARAHTPALGQLATLSAGQAWPSRNLTAAFNAT